MQDLNKNISLKKFSRVYPPRFSRLERKSSATRHTQDSGRSAIKTKEGSARASTTQNIDLPPCNSETTISKATIQCSSASSLLPLRKFELPDRSSSLRFTSKHQQIVPFNDEHLRSTSTQTFSEVTQSPLECTESVIHLNELKDSDEDISIPNPRHRLKSKNTAARKDEAGAKSGNHQKESLTHFIQKNVQKDIEKQEEYLASKKLKRPQHQVVGFLEDHAEFGSDWLETAEGRGKYCPSVLESTVDGSIVKGARRSYGSRNTNFRDPTFLTSSDATQSGAGHKDSLIFLDECGLKTEQHKYKCSMCEVTSRSRLDVEEHITAVGAQHAEAVVLVLLGTQARGRSCPVCNIRLNRIQLFQHIRNSHSDSFPLRCGYCVFLGQDYYQLRHHIRKKHGTTKYHIIDVPRILAENHQDTGSSMFVAGEKAIGGEAEDVKNMPQKNPLVCPICEKVLKTLSNLKKHIAQHSRQKRQCSLCSFTTTFPTQIRSHYRRKHPTQTPQWQTIVLEKDGSNVFVEDVAPYLKHITSKYGIRQPKKEGKWMRQYRCPHCEYTCNFNSSYNRHLRLHSGVKPFKCGYCDFHAREAYVIRKHCIKVHKGNEPLVEDDKDFKAPYRYGTRLKKEDDDWTECTGDEEWIIDNPKESTLSSSVTVKMNESNLQMNKIPVNTSTSTRMKSCQEIECSSDKALFCSPTSQKEKHNRKNFKLHKECNSHENELHSLPQHKSSHKCLLASKDVSQRRGDSSATASNSQTVNKSAITVSERSIFHPATHSAEEHSPEQMNTQETFNGGIPEINNLVSLVKTVHCDEKSNQQSSRFQLPVSEPSAVLPIKGKSQKNQLMINKFQNQMNEMKNTNNSTTLHSSQWKLQRNDNTSLDTEFNISKSRQEEVTSSITLVECCFEMEEKNIIIFLDTKDTETLFVDKVVHSESLHIEEPAVSYQDSIEARNSNSHIVNRNFGGHSAQLLMENNKSLGHGILPETSLLPTHEPNDNEQKHNNPSGNAPSSAAPSEGLENTLHSHIAFLSDQRAQRLNNCVSATPGVMTRDLLHLDYTNNDYFSTKKVRLMMKRKGGQVKCRECGVTTTYRAFYKHAKKHFNIKPFQCGYCSYRSIEKSKIRVHNTFCHPGRPYVILKLSPESAGVNSNGMCAQKGTYNQGNNGNNEVVDKDSLISPKAKSSSHLPKDAPASSSTISEGSDLDINVKTFRNSKRNCPAQTTLPAVISPPPRQPLFHCPLCFKFLQKHTPSIRRHLYSHYSYKPFKCGYCSYTGIGQSEVRAHHVTHGFKVAPKVEPSGALMPQSLKTLISTITSQQRGAQPSHKRRAQACQQTSLPQSDAQQRQTPNGNQSNLEPPDERNCCLPQTPGRKTLASETAYAVQVLGSTENPSSSNTLSPQLDLNLETLILL